MFFFFPFSIVQGHVSLPQSRFCFKSLPRNKQKTKLGTDSYSVYASQVEFNNIHY
jgi:hypothetical protein